MVDDPRDRLRGLGLVLQALAAMLFIFPLAEFLEHLVRDHDYGPGAGELFRSSILPLVIIVLQYVTGWVLVRVRALAVGVAIVHALVALAAGVYIGLESSRTSTLDQVSAIAAIAAWPLAVLVAVLLGPRTPYVRRRADLGGVLFAFGLTVTLAQVLQIVEFLRNYSLFAGFMDGWTLLLVMAQPFALIVIGTFAILAGIEQSGAQRPGWSLLGGYLLVTLIVTVVIVGINIAVLALMDSELRSVKRQLVFVAVFVVYLLANPAVIWRYAANTRPLDVPDSAAAAAGVRWAILYATIIGGIRLLRGFDETPDGWDEMLAFVLAIAIVGLGAAVVAMPAYRRAAMWCSLIASGCAAAFGILVWVTTKRHRVQAEMLWPTVAELALFLSLAWLNRPSVRGERSLAAVFE